MKKLLTLLYIFYFASCSNSKDLSSARYAKTINQKDLHEYLSVLAADSFEGREAGTEGQKKAAKYVLSKFEEFGLDPVIEKNGKKTYSQEFTMHKKGRRKYSSLPLILDEKDRLSEDELENYVKTENIIGVLEGSEKKNEYIVISAHYDHIGQNYKGIYNGADDNGSGTSALLEIAEAFSIAKKNNKGPKRTIIFAAFTAEEKGLIGSRYYVENPHVQLKNIIANLNIDMVGRNGNDFIHVIGASIEDPGLEEIIEDANKQYTKLRLDYSLDAGETPSSIYRRSDQYNFSRFGIPAVFFYGGHHYDYHKTSDTVDKINFEGLSKRTKLIFHTAWELANRPERIDID